MGRAGVEATLEAKPIDIASLQVKTNAVFNLKVEKNKFPGRPWTHNSQIHYQQLAGSIPAGGSPPNRLRFQLFANQSVTAGRTARHVLFALGAVGRLRIGF